MARSVLGLDIGSNSVGSAWIDLDTGTITTGVSVFPAGVDERDDKRGEPKNSKRRMARRTRLTLARRAERKRELRLKLIEIGLLPGDEAGFKSLLEATDPWELRRKGLNEPLTPHEFGRVLLHLAQRRGAMGLKTAEPDADDDSDAKDDGKIKEAISKVRAMMLEREARTFGEFIAMIRKERIIPIQSEDKRRPGKRGGPREWRQAVRNKAASYEHCANRAMIRDEFAKLWDKQKSLGGQTSPLLTDDLRRALDDETGDSVWLHKGLLFGQRRATWDLGTLGRCVLEPSERCVPHADMYASRYRVIETVNNLKIIEGTNPPRPLTIDERERIKAYLSGPLGVETASNRKGMPKSTVSVTDLRNLMGTSKEGWGRATKNSRFRFNIESDEDRTINTDWFHREIVHGAISVDAWNSMPENLREGFNRAILRHNPDADGQAEKLKAGVMNWGGLDEARADLLVAAWKRRPRLDAKRLNMSRRAVRNLLTVMDQPWPDDRSPLDYRWPTQIEARKSIAGQDDFRDATTGQPLDDATRRRYATGAKGATARDRYYMGKHILRKNGQPAIDPATGSPLAEPPPAPLISNPVVRKAIHEVRRHVVAYMIAHGRRPDAISIELARDAKMGKVDADRLLLRNRLRNRIRLDIIETHNLHGHTTTQQRAAVNRVLLCVQQDGVCPLCGNPNGPTITPQMAAAGTDCEVAHIIPLASGGDNGLGNIVLSHTKCNREMGRRTPRQYWGSGPGFEQGMQWVAGIYSDVKRPKLSQIKGATGPSLWSCYFNKRDDAQKIERFQKDISDQDVQGFTKLQQAATQYATRQVMAYLSDALYGGKGLPERSTGADDPEHKQTIFAGNGLWTSRLRREWGLFYDIHGMKAKGLSVEAEDDRKEKNRGDHHHHAIDAVVTALCSRSVQEMWKAREIAAEREVPNSAHEEAMENYRRRHRLRPPAPFDYPSLTADEAIERFREEVKRAVFGEDGTKPICHRPVKRKLIGALHEETLFGPVLDRAGQLTDNYTAKKSVLTLSPNHLRLPCTETREVAITRLTARRMRERGCDEPTARKWARSVVASPAFTPTIVDPPPMKSGIVRDRALRLRLRKCLEEHGLDPDNFTPNDIKKLYDAGHFKHESGVPIKSMVLLRTMSDPVIIHRKRPDYSTGRMVYDDDPASRRAYVGGNNHHIEIREDANGNWTGEIVTAFQVAQRKLAKLRAFKKAGVPRPAELRALPLAERRQWRPIISRIEADHPLVDRNHTDAGRFVMSLCEGEMVWMKHKATGEVSYFVVAKLDKPQSVVLVPHWDARAAGERKDANGKKVPHSKREQFVATPSDLKALAPDGHPHARKVWVSPLGDVTILNGD